MESLSPVHWWESFSSNIEESTLHAARALQSAIASTTGVERAFSSFGLVHSKLRNRLGTEKAAKLVTIFKAFNQKSTLQNNWGKLLPDN